MSTITVTNRELLAINDSCKKLKAEDMPFKVAYALGRTLNHLKKPIKEYNDSLKLIQDELSEKDEKGNKKIQGDRLIISDIDKFNTVVGELLDETVTVRVLKVNVKVMENLSGLDPEVLSPLIGTIIVDDANDNVSEQSE